MKQLTPDELRRPSLEEYRQTDKMPVVVVLDNVRSGLNVGAIFRTCDAFHVEAIYLCGITAVPPHAEIMKTALGATASVTWFFYMETTEALKDLKEKGYFLLPVEQTNQSLFLDQLDPSKYAPAALIFGNEMRGIQPEVLQMCTQSIEIPQHGTKHSLNVATSAGIVLWAFYQNYRRRLLGSRL